MECYLFGFEYRFARGEKLSARGGVTPQIRSGSLKAGTGGFAI
jgi:hypothetical protein